MEDKVSSYGKLNLTNFAATKKKENTCCQIKKIIKPASLFLDLPEVQPVYFFATLVNSDIWRVKSNYFRIYH